MAVAIKPGDMSEIRKKLQTADSLQILNVVKQILDGIKKLHEESKTKKSNEINTYISVMSFLFEMPHHPDPLVCATACKGMVELFRCGIVPQTQIIPALTSSLTKWPMESPMCDGPIIYSLMRVLDIIIAECNKYPDKFPTTFKIVFPPHPLVTVVAMNERHWETIKRCMIDENGLYCAKLRRHFFWFVPLFQYMVLCPKGTLSEHVQMSCIPVMFSVYPCNRNFILDCICWLQLEDTVAASDHFYHHLYMLTIDTSDEEMADVMAPMVASLVRKMVLRGLDVSLHLNHVYRLCQNFPRSTNVVLITLAEVITNCPAPYLAAVLKTCVLILERGHATHFSHWMLVGVLCPWLIKPSNLDEEILSYGRHIVELAEELGPMEESDTRTDIEELCSSFVYQHCAHTNTDVLDATVCARQIEKWMGRHEYVASTMQKFFAHCNEPYVEFGTKKPIMKVFASGLYLSLVDPKMKDYSLRFLISLGCEASLPLFLYAMSKEENPINLFQILHVIPNVAKEKNQVPLVLKVIRSLTTGRPNKLATIQLKMYESLYLTDERCYPYLLNCLKERTTDILQEGDVTLWEIITAQAYCMRQICSTNPLKHPDDMLKLTVCLLYRCREKCGTVPTVLAMEALGQLCEHGALDPVTTYNELIPIFLEDPRLDVRIKFMELASHVPKVLRESTEDHSDLKNKLLTQLYDNIARLDSDYAVPSFSILCLFQPEEIPLDLFPRKYFNVPEMKPFYRPDQDAYTGFDCVPGECWLQMYFDVAKLPDAEDKAAFSLAMWIIIELNEYRFRSRDSTREPNDYNHLPKTSILRAVVRYLKFHTGSKHSFEVRKCLEILNEVGTRTFPAVNWNFLNLHLSDHDELVLAILIRQAIVSGTARRIVTNYIADIYKVVYDQHSNPINGSELQKSLPSILIHMPALCQMLPIANLQCLIELTFSFAALSRIDPQTMTIATAKPTDEKGPKSFFAFTMEVFRDTLRTHILDENLQYIAKKIIALWNTTGQKDVGFAELLETTSYLPADILEKVSRAGTSNHPERTNNLMLLRCTLVVKCLEYPTGGNRYVWLNDFIVDEDCYSQIEERFLLGHLMQVLRACEGDKGHAWEWLLSLMGLITNRNEDHRQMDQVIFFCNIFIAAIVAFSTYQIFLHELQSFQDLYLYFPQAIRNIYTYQVSQPLIEWMMDTRTWIPDILLKRLFCDGIAALRYSQYFKKHSVWTKTFLYYS